MPKHFITEEIADSLRQSVPFVCKLIRNKRLKAVRVGKRWLVAPADLQAYLDGLNAEQSATA